MSSYFSCRRGPQSEPSPEPKEPNISTGTSTGSSGLFSSATGLGGSGAGVKASESRSGDAGRGNGALTSQPLLAAWQRSLFWLSNTCRTNVHVDTMDERAGKITAVRPGTEKHSPQIQSLPPTGRCVFGRSIFCLRERFLPTITPALDHSRNRSVHSQYWR